MLHKKIFNHPVSEINLIYSHRYGYYVQSKEPVPTLTVEDYTIEYQSNDIIETVNIRCSPKDIYKELKQIGLDKEICWIKLK